MRGCEAALLEGASLCQAAAAYPEKTEEGKGTVGNTYRTDKGSGAHERDSNSGLCTTALTPHCQQGLGVQEVCRHGYTHTMLSTHPNSWRGLKARSLHTQAVTGSRLLTPFKPAAAERGTCLHRGARATIQSPHRD